MATLVRRYYRAGVAHDGAEACRLLYSLLAESVPKVYGKFPGPASLRGSTCPQVMSKLLKQQSKRFATSPRVIEVRVQGNQGIALLRLRGGAQHHLYLHREHGVWKVGSLLDMERP